MTASNDESANGVGKFRFLGPWMIGNLVETHVLAVNDPACDVERAQRVPLPIMTRGRN